MKASGIIVITLVSCLGATAVAQDTFTVDITRTNGSGTVGPGETIEFTIDGLLTNTDSPVNEGLAFFAFDLELVGPTPINLGSGILMGEGIAVASFSQPQGYSVDFTGTIVDDDLIQAGGGQNTINNTGADPFPPFPMGSVDLGVGHPPDGVELFIGAPTPAGLTIPVDFTGEPGTTYTLQIKPGSLFANVITDFIDPDYEVDPVQTVIGNSLSFVFEPCLDTAPPVIEHGTALPGETSPCAGYIDPRIESTDGVAFDRGLQELTFKFDRNVFKADGVTAIDAGDFSITETGAGPAPTITVADYVGGDQSLVLVQWDRPITLQEWTTVIADVYSDCGTPITNNGDQGPDVDEPDRIDIAFLPGDVNQGAVVEPFDLLAFRLFVNDGTFPADVCSAVDLDYFDINRGGDVDPFDLLDLRRIINGVPPATRAWASETLNNPRP